MSFPNPDNYARDCSCGPENSSTAPAALQSQLNTLELKLEQAYRDIPVPVIHLGDSFVTTRIGISYLPNQTNSLWLTPDTEVWLFYYKHSKRSAGYNRGPFLGRYGHPRDTSKPLRNTRYYGGDGVAMQSWTCRSEFSFLKNGQLPKAMEIVPLTGFDPHHFYRIKLSSPSIVYRQLLPTDFPITGYNFALNRPNYAFTKWRFPVSPAGVSFAKNKTSVRFQFRFAIPNPDAATTGLPKLFGPPSNVVHCNVIKFNDSVKTGASASLTGINLKQ